MNGSAGPDAPLVLVTGASGYIGGRLVPAATEATALSAGTGAPAPSHAGPGAASPTVDDEESA